MSDNTQEMARTYSPEQRREDRNLVHARPVLGATYTCEDGAARLEEIIAAAERLGYGVTDWRSSRGELIVRPTMPTGSSYVYELLTYNNRGQMCSATAFQMYKPAGPRTDFSLYHFDRDGRYTRREEWTASADSRPERAYVEMAPPRRFLARLIWYSIHHS